VRTILTDCPFLVEAFAASNLAFLVLDIWVAHSVNDFHHPAEWIPFWYALAGAAALTGNLALARPLRSGARRAYHEGAGRWIGIGVGFTGVLVGVSGLLWHLSSSFFERTTLESLVYSAPFVAPLAFAGVGFLVLLNRMVDHDSREWTRWVLLLAWGGLAGCFVLALVDHAQNGFFHPLEWVSVAAGAMATAFFAVPLLARVPRGFWTALLWVAGVTAAIGTLGFALHVAPLLGEGRAPFLDRVIYGPPPFAPLLFADLAALAAIGAWDARSRSPGANV